MRAGKRDRRVLLLRRAAAADNGYELVPGDWAALGGRLASVQAVQRSEQGEGAGLVARRLMSFWLLRDSLTRTLTAQDAVQFDGWIYELTGEPLPIGRRDVELLGVAVVQAAAAEPPAPTGGQLDFSDAAQSGLLALILEDF